MIALADAFGAARFHLVGHDWGAVIGWWVAAQHADRLERVPAPLPLVLAHGWPDSVFRFVKLIPLLTDPAAWRRRGDTFNVVVPSLRWDGAELDRYIGYWKPCATSHDELDRDTAIQKKVHNAARTLCESLRVQRAERLRQSDQSREEPRPK